LLPGLKVEASTSGGIAAQIAAVAIANRVSPPTAKPAPAKSSWSSVSMEENFGAKSAPDPAAQPAPSRSMASSVATADPDSQPTSTVDPQPSETDGFDLHPPVFLGKGTNGDPFMISSRSQREVVQSMAWKSTLCIWGGPILTLACLYFLALSFGWT